MLRRLNFHIAPGTPGQRRLPQDFDLLLRDARKKTAALFSPAGGDEHSARPVPAEMGEERLPFGGILEVVEAQLQCARFPKAQAELRAHPGRGFRRDHATNTVFSEKTLQGTSTRKPSFRLLPCG